MAQRLASWAPPRFVRRWASTMNPARRDPDATSTPAALPAVSATSHNLPRAFFVDPDIHRRDLERLFLGHWIVAGHVASIPRQGDYFLYDLGVESFVISRGERDAVHACVNVCRHRGSRVAIEEYGHCRELVCPMHAWTYAQDGKLVAAPNMPPDFDRDSLGLLRAHVEVVSGVIFLCLDAPPDVAPLRRDIEAALAQYDFAHTRIAYHRRYLCPANWKLVQQCFLELHVSGGSFPEMCRVMLKSEVAATGDPSLHRKYEAFAATWRRDANRRPIAASHATADPALDYTCRREPIRPGFATQSESGAAIAPLLGAQAASDGGVAVIRVLASWIVVCADHAVIVRLTPLEPQVTEMDVTWLVRTSAVEGADYDAPRLSWLWRANVERVLKLASDNQLGVNATRYLPGPFAVDEVEIEAWVAWYLARLA